METILIAIVVGLIGGLASGFLGVSSGGILVPLIVLGLRLDQHSAQGASLLAQVLPTGFLGARRYRSSGHSVPTSWLGVVGGGYAAGGVAGALATSYIAGSALTWSYVAYLLVLVFLVALRSSRSTNHVAADGPIVPLPFPALAITGIIAGVSSGLLGIGGGLAITALGAGMLHLPQHRAQAISLAISVLPLTAPAALVYALQGWPIPWLAVAGIVLGLVVGTAAGAKLATGISPERLRGAFVVLVLAMAAAMAAKAVSIV